MPVLSLIFGGIVGFSLGLTGGGGSLFAIPLLVYGLDLDISEAIGVSLASVGLAALVGAMNRIRKKQVELSTGVIFGVAGMLGIPVGTWLIDYFHKDVLLSLFALLMFCIAIRMWYRSSSKRVDSPDAAVPETARIFCQRDESGKLIITPQCLIVLMMAGFVTGVLSRLFGVGGGFVIVPALVAFGSMDIHKAVATSLFVIALISSCGVASYIVEGRQLSLNTTVLFAGGGILGVIAGSWVGEKLPSEVLQKVFAVAIVLVAIFVIVKTWFIG